MGRQMARAPVAGQRPGEPLAGASGVVEGRSSSGFEQSPLQGHACPQAQEDAKGAEQSQGSTRTMQRKPMWQVEVSIPWAMRAAGR